MSGFVQVTVGSKPSEDWSTIILSNFMFVLRRFHPYIKAPVPVTICS